MEENKENKEKIYLEITPEVEELIGKISKIGNELAEYFGTESMFEPNRTKESLYFLFAINEESSNLDVMFELDINLCYNREILANEVILAFNQRDLEYVLKIKGELRDRQFEQTVKEYEKFIRRLEQKVDVKKLYVEITGQGKKIYWKKGLEK